MCVVENSFLNPRCVTDEAVIIRHYYQGLFLKKPPLPPQKLLICTPRNAGLLCSLV